MLSDQSRPVIAATLPVVGENLDEITQRFYTHLFEAHPELLDGVFNRGNQAGGRQQKALAGSIAAFAGHLLNKADELPDQLLARISHKHASLGIRPEQYGVVHEHLMWAVVDVLGEAVTPEVAAAWDEVYWLMANVLINQERDLYRTAGLAAGEVWREWTITRKTAETEGVVTLVLEPSDGGTAAASLPGQYVSVRIPMQDGLLQPRQYSLSRADDGSRRQITVKRERPASGPQGEVSAALHDRFAVGDRVQVSAPFGEMVLQPSDRPLVLASAGVGVTPHAGMLSHLARTGSQRSVTFLHVDRNPGPAILQRQLKEDLAGLASARFVAWDSTTGAFRGGSHDRRPGRMNLDPIALPAGAEYFLCGPLSFMQGIRTSLLRRGVSPRDIHYEVFGPDLWIADDVAQAA
ncbi:hemin transporter [Arthrobacter frigidicola]|nr:hemin transporter [Arthrobacter frigidicola]